MLTCGRCGESKPFDAFYWSKGKPKTAWCKACYRERYLARYTPSTGADDTARTGADDTARPCSWCQQGFTPRQRRPADFCSRLCKDAARNHARQVSNNAAKGERTCRWCAGPLPNTMRSDATFCSEECNSAAHQVTRKMAKRAGLPRSPKLVSRQEIADRDLWRCGLCGGRVARERRHPDPLCASIDHIIPLAEGGTNEPDNLQLAHLRCNLRKRAVTHEKGELLFVEAS